MDGTLSIAEAATVVVDTPQIEPQSEAPRDYEAEARDHGWTPKEEFKGDPAKWVDAETFARRADEVMPFLKKQNGALKREMEDLKKTLKQASTHFSKVEERAYNRALADLEAKHAEAVELGDNAASRAIRQEMADLAKPQVEVAPAFDPAAERKKITEWIDQSPWYATDENRRFYADLQAKEMGDAHEWEGGTEGWLAEIDRRVARKFADKKPVLTGGGGNRAAPAGGGKSSADLPAEAKALGAKFVKAGIYPSLDAYAKDYDWNAA